MVSIIVITVGVFTISLYLAYRAIKGSSGGGETAVFDNVVLLIRVPKESDKTEKMVAQKAPMLAEQMFASLHGLLRLTPEIQEHLSFEIAADHTGIRFYVAVPRQLRSFVESQIYAQYPNAEIKEADDYASLSPGELAGLTVAISNVGLSKPDFFPLRTFRDFEVDPLASVTSAMSELKEGDQVWLQILARPVPDGWQEEGHTYVTKVREGSPPPETLWDIFVSGVTDELFSLPLKVLKSVFVPSDSAESLSDSKGDVRLSAGQALSLEAIENKLSRVGFEVGVRAVALSPSPDSAASRLRGVVASFKQFSTADLNSLIQQDAVADKVSFIDNYRRRTLDSNTTFVFSTEELGSIYHLPSAFVETPSIVWSPAKRSEPPLDLPVDDCTFFAKTTFREGMIKFGIRDSDRFQHVYALGKSGAGKSVLFENMAIQDIRNGKGVIVIDPHGNLVSKLLDHIPDDRVDDVVLFDPSDLDHPLALNPLECTDPHQRNLVASGVVGALKQQFEFSWGPRLEHLLNNTVLTLAAIPNTTFLGITRLLTDKNYQKYMVYTLDDPILRDFWEVEYRDMMSNPRLVTEAVAPIQNKVGRFLASTTLRHILGQPKSTLRLDEIMNEGKILLADLSKGKIGEDNSNLLGSILVARMQFMVMQRVGLREEEMEPVFLYVDEFQNFSAAGAFESILSEARKYNLGLHLTHQYVAQLPDELREAVFGNVGTFITFSLGASDAEAVSTEFSPIFDETDVISLEKYHVYLRLLVDRQSSPPFSAVTLPPIPDEESTGNREKVIQQSREKYGTDVKQIEERIRRWAEKDYSLGLAKAEAARRGDSPMPTRVRPARAGLTGGAGGYPPKWKGGGGKRGPKRKPLQGNVAVRRPPRG